jgi:hypothetical protein
MAKPLSKELPERIVEAVERGEARRTASCSSSMRLGPVQREGRPGSYRPSYPTDIGWRVSTALTRLQPMRSTSAKSCAVDKTDHAVLDLRPMEPMLEPLGEETNHPCRPTARSSRGRRASSETPKVLPRTAAVPDHDRQSRRSLAELHWLRRHEHRSAGRNHAERTACEIRFTRAAGTTGVTPPPRCRRPPRH